MLKRMSHSFLRAFAFAVVFSAAAEEVSLETAGEAAQSWVDGGYSLGTMRGRRMASGETVEAGGAKVHVVRFEGGGFVAMGADDLVDPVIAFSPSGKNLSQDDRSPLRAILGADLALRARAAARQEVDASAAKAGRTLLGAAAASSARTESQRRWDRLLGRGSGGAGLLRASTSSGPLDAVSDVRVEPLVKSRWGQENNSRYINYGEPCFNYYTPNNYPCGCVATAMAQIMRYHRYPAFGAVVTKTCRVGGENQKSFTTKGGEYNYDAMPLVPTVDEDIPWYECGATEAQREAIGRLTYDCGVMMQMWWRQDGSPSGGAGAASVLKTSNMFKYRNAVVNTCKANLGDEDFRNRMIYPNLDAGMPVILGLADHQVIADGYGYSDGTLYTHLNMGWADECDVWYALPEISTADGEYSSSTIEAVIYNVFPTQTGEIVSGRVLSDDGIPVGGVMVSIRESADTAVISNIVTGVRGTFAFIVPSGRTYVVSAAWGDCSASARCSTGTSSSSSVTLGIGTCTVNSTTKMTCGNVWGCDLVLPGLRTVSAPEFDPGDCEFRLSTNVVITCATSGATIRYTTDGSDPTEESPVYCDPVLITHRTSLKARAFMAGLSPSPVVSSEYADPLEGDAYEQPILIDGSSGSHNISDNSGFGKNADEPNLTGYIYDRPYSEYSSVWYLWKSEGTGTVAFRFSGVTKHNVYMLPAVAVYEDAPTLPELSPDPLAVAAGDWSSCEFAEVSLHAEAGKVYRIFGLQWYYDDIGSLRLAWSAGDDWHDGKEAEVKHSVEFGWRGADGEWHLVDVRYVRHDDVLGELPPLPEDDAYEFDGWTFAGRDADGQAVDVPASAEMPVSEDMILISPCRRRPAVAFDADSYTFVAGVPLVGGEIVPTVRSGYTLKAAGLPSGIKFDAATMRMTGVPTAKGGAYPVTFTATPGPDLKKAGASVETETITINIKYPVVAVRSASWRDADAAGSVKGGGEVAANKKVTLTATPAKGSVFLGWYCGGECVSASPSYAFVATAEDKAFTAVFATSKEDAANVKLELDGREVVRDETGSTYHGEMSTNVMCGVALQWHIASHALSATQVKVSGLPSGLKFADKPVTAKIGSGKDAVVVTNVPANTIYGAPSAASSVDKKTGEVKPSEVKLTVTTAGKTTVAYLLRMTVDPLPAWAVGNFEGVVTAQQGTTRGHGGVSSMSVTVAGKVSGKVLLDGASWTFKSDSFSAASATSDEFSLSIDAAAYAGKETRGISLALGRMQTSYMQNSATSRAKGTFGGDCINLARLPWADKGDAASAKLLAKYAGAYTCKVMSGSDVGIAKFTVDEKGVAKGAIELPDGAKTRKVSFSAGVVPHEEYVSLAMYSAPNAKKGYPAVFDIRRLAPFSGLEEEGVAYRDPGVVATTAELTAGSGASGVVSVNPKYGQAVPGKDVALTAKADKGSVFSRWEFPADWMQGIDPASPTIKFKMMADGDIPVKAFFVTVEEDRKHIKLVVDGVTLSSDGSNQGTASPHRRVPCGVALNWSVLASTLSKSTVKASGLPSGLKLVQDKATGAYSLAGVPSAASKLDKNSGEALPSNVKFTVTTAGKSTASFTLPLYVDAIPDDVVGAYNGMLVGFTDATAGDSWLAHGMMTLTVASNGKLSAKAVLPSRALSFSVDGWSSLRDGVYAAEMRAKSGEVLYLELDGARDWRGARIEPQTSFIETDKDAEYRVVAWRNEHAKGGRIAADAAASDLISRIVAFKKLCYVVAEAEGGGYAVAEVAATDKSANLTISLAAGGAVKYSGKIGGKSISGKSVLAIAGTDYRVNGDAVVPLNKTESLYFALGFARADDGSPIPELTVSHVKEDM